MHPPFHLYEFHLNSFNMLGKRLGFTVADHNYMVGNIYHFPKLLHPLVSRYMKWSNTQMQLTVYLKKIE